MGEAIIYSGTRPVEPRTRSVELISHYTAYETDIEQAPASSKTAFIDTPQPEADWQSLKHNFSVMRERIGLAKTEIQTLGYLAMLNLDKAHSTIQNYQENYQKEDTKPEIWAYEPLSFKERVQMRASEIQYEQRVNRKRTVAKAAGWTAATAVSVAFGWLAAKYPAKYIP